MNKRFIPTLSIFMSLSLLIFISLQIFWLKQSIEANDLDFSSKVYNSLENVTNKINQKELKTYYALFNTLISNSKKNKYQKPKINIIQSIIDSANSQYVVYKKYIIEEGKILIPKKKNYHLSQIPI